MVNLLSTKVAYAGSTNLDGFISNVSEFIINPLIVFLFALALVYFLYGLLEFIAGGTSDEKRTVGKRHMLGGVVGLTVMMGVWFILGVVLNTFGIPKDQIDPEQGKVDLPDIP